VDVEVDFVISVDIGGIRGLVVSGLFISYHSVFLLSLSCFLYLAFSFSLSLSRFLCNISMVG
jgi:hypothetical protein